MFKTMLHEYEKSKILLATCIFILINMQPAYLARENDAAGKTWLPINSRALLIAHIKASKRFKISSIGRWYKIERNYYPDQLLLV